jgi:ABC-type multidrug transport system fused ATPase/permease subunit
VNCGLFCAQMMGVLFILFWLSPQLAPILAILMISISAIVAIYKRTTVVVFKAYGMAQAQIIECANETFSAIRTVRSFGGERRQTSRFDEEVLAYQKSGNRLGWLKSTNESWTRIAIYVSLMALYILGGSKVKVVSEYYCFYLKRLSALVAVFSCSFTDVVLHHFLLASLINLRAQILFSS